jgi:hypothetical protein
MMWSASPCHQRIGVLTSATRNPPVATEQHDVVDRRAQVPGVEDVVEEHRAELRPVQHRAVTRR